MAGIFVVNGHIDAGFFGNELKHIAPAGPFGRNVVADGGFAGLCKNVCEAETAHHQSGTKSKFAEVAATDCGHFCNPEVGNQCGVSLFFKDAATIIGRYVETMMVLCRDDDKKNGRRTGRLPQISIR